MNFLALREFRDRLPSEGGPRCRWSSHFSHQAHDHQVLLRNHCSNREWSPLVGSGG
jgi:hypothetical protein